MDTFLLSFKKAFSQNDSTLKYFHERAMANLDQSQKSLNKAANYLVVLAIIYFVIVQSSVESIEIGPFKINNLNIIIKIFPLLVAYKWYEYYSLQSFVNLLYAANEEAVKKLYPDIHKNNLHLLLYPENNTTTEQIYETRSAGVVSIILEGLHFLTLVIQYFLFPIVLIVYAVYLNFVRFGTKDILVWTVLIFVSVFILQTIILVIANDAQQKGR